MVSNIRIAYVKAHTVGIYIVSLSAMANLNSQFYQNIFLWIALEMGKTLNIPLLYIMNNLQF